MERTKEERVNAKMRQLAQALINKAKRVSMKDIDSQRLAIVSTAHMNKEDAEKLNSGVHPDGLHLKGEYGWQFTSCIDRDVWESLGFSREFFDNVLAILADGYDRVEFDQDGPVVEGLAKFDW